MKKYTLYLVEYLKDNIIRIDYIKASNIKEALIKFEEWQMSQTSKIEVTEIKVSKIDLIDE